MDILPSDSDRSQNPELSKRWGDREHGKSIVVRVNKENKELYEENEKKRNKLFVEDGTIFTKYGRMGQPKQRLVHLNKEMTEILWKDRVKNDKPRKILIEELTTVAIGSDHTEVMRK